MNIGMNSYIIRGIAMGGTGGHLPQPVHSCLKIQMATKKLFGAFMGTPPLLKSWLSPWLYIKKIIIHTPPRYLMVHALVSQCGFFLISHPAITIGVIPPHSVHCIVLYWRWPSINCIMWWAGQARQDEQDESIWCTPLTRGWLTKLLVYFSYRNDCTQNSFRSMWLRITLKCKWLNRIMCISQNCQNVLLL